MRQVEDTESRLEIAVIGEYYLAVAQRIADEAGGVDDEVVAVCGDAVDVAMAGEGHGDGRAFPDGLAQFVGVFDHAAVSIEFGQEPGVEKEQESVAVREGSIGG